MGQFERTLIIAEEGLLVSYVEGCIAPTYSSSSLHSAVVEIIAMPGARVRYYTILSGLLLSKILLLNGLIVILAVVLL